MSRKHPKRNKDADFKRNKKRKLTDHQKWIGKYMRSLIDEEIQGLRRFPSINRGHHKWMASTWWNNIVILTEQRIAFKKVEDALEEWVEAMRETRRVYKEWAKSWDS